MIALLLVAAAIQTQADLNARALADWHRADATLNATYRRALARERAKGSDAGEALIVAQRAWVAFRDAECWSTSFGSRTGSIHPMEEAMCRASLTRQRTLQLKARYDRP